MCLGHCCSVQFVCALHTNLWCGKYTWKTVCLAHYKVMRCAYCDLGSTPDLGVLHTLLFLQCRA